MTTAKEEFNTLANKGGEKTNGLLKSMVFLHRYSLEQIADIVKKFGLDLFGQVFCFGDDTNFDEHCNICQKKFHSSTTEDQKINHFLGKSHWEKFEKLLSDNNLPRPSRFIFIKNKIETTDFSSFYRNKITQMYVF